ncbi:MAG: hypothetical protein ACJ74T_02980 [Pyrinomonadaceae bacterium]
MTRVVDEATTDVVTQPTQGQLNSDGPRRSGRGRKGPGFFERLKVTLGIAPRPARVFEGPVAWLLGSQMLGSIKGILLYSAYGKKLDPRDWMTAKAFSFDPRNTDKRFELPGGITKEYLDAAIDQKDGFWFDYISDTGDGMRATYSIAYLSLCDLTLSSLEPKALTAGEELGKLKAGAAAPNGHRRLPRGEFLFVGGDTAYHASDYMTLVNRIQNTFEWAHEDAGRDQMLGAEARRRPLFGIPGNHDYYDQLDGFRRQFRHSSRWEPGSPGPEPANYQKKAQLIIGGYNRVQEASYLALRLPFGWTLWGLDTEVGQIDNRQKNFFQRLCRPAGHEDDAPFNAPKKLIVATCSPTTAFGKLADPKDYKSADAFGQLNLDQPFLPKAGKEKAKEAGPARGYSYDLLETGDVRLEKSNCRLDLSGDVHHYARYWGPPRLSGGIEPRVGVEPRAEARNADSYASVVSGIGGAFHHPSETYVGEVREQALYPSEQVSTEEVSRSIFDFRTIWMGGNVFLAGAIVAFIIYFAFAVPQSSREFLHNFLPGRLHLTDQQQIKPTVLRPTPTAADKSDDKTESATGDNNEEKLLTPWWGGWLGVARIPPHERVPKDLFCEPGAPRYFFGPCKVPPPFYFWPGILCLIGASVPLFVAAFRKLLYEHEPAEGSDSGTDAMHSATVQTPSGDEIKPDDTPELKEAFGPVIRRFGLGLLLFALGALAISPFWEYITPFANSLIVLLTFAWAVAAATLGIRYSEYLFKKKQQPHPFEDERRHPFIEWMEGWLPWILPALGVFVFGFGLWAFGQNNPAALLISDGLFVAVVIGLCVGLCWALPFKVGADLFATKSKATRVTGKILIGAWHFILQIAVPLLLVRKASLLLWLVVAGLVLLGTAGGRAMLRSKKGRSLLGGAWFILGVLVLLLPYVVKWLSNVGWVAAANVPWLTQEWFAGPTWTGWWGLLPAAFAAVAGAVLCCYWFGWYLGVCFAFNGHNNEVGGAARIERFKQFIRFRLTEEGELTGYVIAVNDPSDDGRELRPHLIDVFRLWPKPES